jgi:hypothetical protein
MVVSIEDMKYVALALACVLLTTFKFFSQYISRSEKSTKAVRSGAIYKPIIGPFDSIGAHTVVVATYASAYFS